MTEKFGFSGLWKHVGSSVIAAGLVIADPLLSYLEVISLPVWAHGLVVFAAMAFAAYKGKVK